MHFILVNKKEQDKQIDACALRYGKNKFYEMKAETFYFLIPFWFDDKIVVKVKTSGIYMGETVLYITIIITIIDELDIISLHEIKD